MSKQRDVKHALDGFPERLKSARRRTGLTQEALSSISDVAVVTLSKLETGKSVPTLDVLMALSGALEVSPNYLTGWEQPTFNGTSAQRLLVARFLLVANEVDPQVLRNFVELIESVASSPERG